MKFLPDGLARDHQALERFQRKARAASALNHPNICTIYEVDEFEDQLFVAMELLDGRTLQNRVTGKAVGIEELANGEQIPHARGNELFLAKRYGSCQSSA